MTEQLQSDKKELLTSVGQILATVNKSAISYASNYWVPSLGRNVRFTEINTAQQKRLIKSIVDSPIHQTEFICTMRDIIRENCVESDVDTDSLTIIDKLMIVLGLRIACIGPTIETDITPKDGKEMKVDIMLTNVYNMAKTALTPIEPSKLESEMYEIVVNVPSIYTEYQLEKQLRSGIDSIEIETNEELRTSIGEAFIGEIVKYVQSVSIKTETGLKEVDWKSFSCRDRIKIVETFGLSLLRKIIDYINVVKKEVDKVELVQFKYNNESFERRLSVDGGFFMIS